MPKLHLFLKTRKRITLALLAIVAQQPLYLNASSMNEEDNRAQGLRYNLGEMLDATNENIARIRRIGNADTKNVIVIGPTGSGKSTLINYLAGSELIAEYRPLRWNLRVNEPLPGFRFSAGTEAGTHLPTSWYDEQSQQPRVYWDCPGFNDNEGPQREIINAYSIYQLLRHAPHSKVMLVISEDILGDRCNSFLNLLKRVTETFPDSAQLHRALSLMVTKATTINNFTNDISKLFREIAHSSPGQLKPDAQNLLLFLADNASTRIGIFPKPTQVGGFNPDKAAILQAIQSANYVENFTIRLSVPAESNAHIDKLAGSYNRAITEHLQGEGEREIIRYFLRFVDQHNGSIVSLRTGIDAKLKTLSTLHHRYPKVMDFIKYLMPFLNDNMQFINHNLDSLEFLQAIKPNIGFHVNDWVRPLHATIEKVHSLKTQPQVRFDELSGQLDIRGIILGTKDINHALRQQQHPIRAINAYALNTLFVDGDIESFGTHLALIAPVWKVIGNRTINVSGRNGDDPQQGVSPTGQDGLPGLPGGNGGHIYIKSHTIYNPAHLTLLARGGNGGRGQDGARGQDGTNGQDADIIALIKDANIVSQKHGVGDGYQTIFTETTYKVSGTQGTPGQSGCRGGVGGIGGYGGNITVVVFDHTHNTLDIEHRESDGNQGQDGQPGAPGKGGLHGKSYQGTYKTNAIESSKSKKKLHHTKRHKNPQADKWKSPPVAVDLLEKTAPAGELRNPQDLNAVNQQRPVQPDGLDSNAKWQDYQTYEQEIQHTPEYEPFMKNFTDSTGQAQ
jgi:energy-coupling factor transporter ATP-binding protein EcfA2